jgi:hypothetical protein
LAIAQGTIFGSTDITVSATGPAPTSYVASKTITLIANQSWVNVPPMAMTADTTTTSDGTYVALARRAPPTGKEAFRAFDNITSSSWETFNLYRTISGVYSGDMNGITDTTNFTYHDTGIVNNQMSGEYIQILLPVLTIVQSYTLTYISAAKAPVTWHLAGQVNGFSEFDGLHHQSTPPTWSGGKVSFTYGSPGFTSMGHFNRYRLIVNTKQSSGTDGNNYSSTGLVQLTMKGVAASSLKSYPPMDPTANVTTVAGNANPLANGTYTYTACSDLVAGSGGDAYRLFAYGLGWPLLGWRTVVFDSITGVYIGNESTTYFDGTTNVSVMGVWVQVQLPNAIQVAYYSLKRKSANPNIPTGWVLLGSANGESWTLLDTRNNMHKTRPTHVTTVFPAPDTTSYMYYRILITTLIPNQSVGSSAGKTDGVTIRLNHM